MHGLGRSLSPRRSCKMLRAMVAMLALGEAIPTRTPAFSLYNGASSSRAQNHDVLGRARAPRKGAKPSIPYTVTWGLMDEPAMSSTGLQRQHRTTESTSTSEQPYRIPRPVAVDRRGWISLGQSAGLAYLAMHVGGVPQAAHAAARPLSLNLVTALRIQNFIESMRRSLAAPEERGATSDVPAQVKYVLKSLDMRGNLEEASRVLKPTARAEEARRHGLEAFEYLSQIVEFSGYDELKRPGVSRFGALSTPEKVEFAQKCLGAAGREMDAFLSSFDGTSVASARELYQMYFPQQ